jgi:hypothetical protein
MLISKYTAIKIFMCGNSIMFEVFLFYEFLICRTSVTSCSQTQVLNYICILYKIFNICFSILVMYVIFHFLQKIWLHEKLNCEHFILRIPFSFWKITNSMK